MIEPALVPLQNPIRLQKKRIRVEIATLFCTNEQDKKPARGTYSIPCVVCLLS